MRLYNSHGMASSLLSVGDFFYERVRIYPFDAKLTSEYI